MANYSQHFSNRQTPQTERADARQVENSAGGFSFELDKWQRLDRWLILGAEGGSYYAGERELTRENATTILECLKEDGERTVETIVAVSVEGRAPKNDPAIFALALAAADPKVGSIAIAVMPKVCRTGAHLFQFVESVQAMRGWGRSLRDGVARWYTSMTPEALAYQVVKYRQRGGISHKDVFRLAHPRAPHGYDVLFRWIVSGAAGLGPREVKRGDVTKAYPAAGALSEYLAAFEELQSTKDGVRVGALIREHRFTHEMVPKEWLASPKIWEALAEHMPTTALIRFLGKLTESGIVAPLSDATDRIAAQLTDEAVLKKARIHPISVLSALKVYQQGHGEKGKLSWTPVPKIVDALDDAFYLAFKNIQPTGKKILLALDVSSSMDSGTIAGVPGLTPRMGAAAMAMVTMRTESSYHVMAFADKLIDVAISPKQRLDDVIDVMQRISFGGTDCSLPMRWAEANGVVADAFVVYTDSETWAGQVHPHQALLSYREKKRPRAKLAVVGMVANKFSIADPTDAGMMDFVGFDTAAPSVLADFVRG